MADFTGNLDMLLSRQKMELDVEPMINRSQSIRSKEKAGGKSKIQPSIAEEQEGITYDKAGRPVRTVCTVLKLIKNIF